MDTSKILIVEDEGITALFLVTALRSFGYEVVGTAASGPAAIAKAAETLPDLVLMDIRLEGPMDGIETAEAILAAHDVAIVYLSAYTDGPEFERAKASPAYGYLAKPVSLKDLHQALETALHKHGRDKESRRPQRRV